MTDVAGVADPDQTIVPASGLQTGGRESQPGDAMGLPPGTRLEEFEILGQVGRGGFGIVYRALDHLLGREVALKEYLPFSIATRSLAQRIQVHHTQYTEPFEAGLRSFVNEARMLAQFDHPALVKVHRFWEANGTAYMVMPLLAGPTLRAVVEQSATPPAEAWLRTLLAPLLDALGVMHAANCLHRDVAPDNIIITAGDHPVLLDLGAARRVLANATTSPTIIVKPGYAPCEQYGTGDASGLGPWTDLYALAATMHFAITGTAPVPAIARLMTDPYVPLAQRAPSGYSSAFLLAIDRALAVRSDDRPQSTGELAQYFGNAPRGRSGPDASGVAVDASGDNDAKPADARRSPARRLAGIVLQAMSSTGAQLATLFATLCVVSIAFVPALRLDAWPPRNLPAAHASHHTLPWWVVDDLYANADADHLVNVHIGRAILRIGHDTPEIAITSSRNGWLYVLRLDPEADRVELLFPNALDESNAITADQVVTLPRKPWSAPVAGPPGTRRMIAIVSDVPRDFTAAGLGPLTPFGQFDPRVLVEGLQSHRGREPLLVGTPICPTRAGGCQSAYGVAGFIVAETRE